MFLLSSLLAYAALASATITITDPSDEISSADWASDNAILADYNVTTTSYQTIAIVGEYSYSNAAANISHKVLYGEGNDTSVLVVANESDVSVAYSTIIKFGYASNLAQSSFFGVNSAVVVANDSVATLSNVNITTHNGAANLYSYGSGTEAYVDNAWLYSSGPTSHGLYAGGNGTVYGKNVYHYSGGNRCSSFSGDSPAGYVHVSDSVAHTDGIGSAICYAVGLCNMTNVIGHASQSPIMFMDGVQTAYWKNCDVTAGLLGGTIMFSSSTRSSGAAVTFENSKLTVLGDTMPGLWFGNIIASADLISTTINNSASGILVVANYSQVTQDFDYYADYDDNSALSPAEATVTVSESSLEGALVAYNESSISFRLSEYSSWTGKTVVGYGHGYFAISLDKTSNWTLTANSALENFTDADTTYSNIFSNGYNITYDSSSSANSKLNGTTVSLSGGGYLTPA
ncbi:hypothetical protein UCRPC4_g05460 [Phaeomoniella chlamydospora]|uniref:Uncharacterized protein n=1 Tax=Phaeomoniella chlamydospora TaxID=158046 RepID=A0A0G2E4A2_PHACM|nr:hypothetical protein UCRPC4_g05460 [Phaeomoniella chlamydospora]